MHLAVGGDFDERVKNRADRTDLKVWDIQPTAADPDMSCPEVKSCLPFHASCKRALPDKRQLSLRAQEYSAH